MKIKIFGNCAAFHLKDSYNNYKDINVSAQYIHTPSNFINIKQFPEILKKKINEHNIGIDIDKQFILFEKNNLPDIAVFFTSHEFSPIFYNEEFDYYIYINKFVLERHREFQKWFLNNHIQISKFSENYLSRFINMIKNIRKIYKKLFIVIIQKLSYLPYYSPFPTSYMPEWKNYQFVAKKSLKNLTKEIGNSLYIDMDEIVVSLIRNKGFTLEQLLPFLVLPKSWYFSKWESPIFNNVLYLRRDLEHINQIIFDEIAKVILKGNGNKKFILERIPDHWLNKMYSPVIPNLDRIEHLLNSNSRFDFANGLEYLIRLLPEDYSELINRYLNENIKDLCILSMLKIYFAFSKNKLSYEIYNKLKSFLTKWNMNFEDKMLFSSKLKEFYEIVINDKFNTFKENIKFLNKILYEDKKISIYGFGYYGKLLFNFIKANNRDKIVYLVDDYSEKFKGEKILKLEDIPKDINIVITVSGKSAYKMYKKCQFMGVKNIYKLSLDICHFLEELSGNFTKFNLLNKIIEDINCPKCGMRMNYISISEYNINELICFKCYYKKEIKYA